MFACIRSFSAIMPTRLTQRNRNWTRLHMQCPHTILHRLEPRLTKSNCSRPRSHAVFSFWHRGWQTWPNELGFEQDSKRGIFALFYTSTTKPSSFRAILDALTHEISFQAQDLELSGPLRLNQFYTLIPILVDLDQVRLHSHAKEWFGPHGLNSWVNWLGFWT